jgi:hypothetical protein
MLSQDWMNTSRNYRSITSLSPVSCGTKAVFYGGEISSRSNEANPWRLRQMKSFRGPLKRGSQLQPLNIPEPREPGNRRFARSACEKACSNGGGGPFRISRERNAPARHDLLVNRQETFCRRPSFSRYSRHKEHDIEQQWTSSY